MVNKAVVIALFVLALAGLVGHGVGHFVQYQLVGLQQMIAR